MENNNTQQIPNATTHSSSPQTATSPQQKQKSSPLQQQGNEVEQQQQTGDKKMLVTDDLSSTSPSVIPPCRPSDTPTALASTGLGQMDCNTLSPTLADILSDDRILRFYQCVKEIKLQQSPQHTSSMFFALCHALGDSVSFLKVPNMNKIMFRQDEQIFAVNLSGSTTSCTFNGTQPPMDSTTTPSVFLPHMASSDGSASTHYPPPNGNQTNNLAAAATAAANLFSLSDQSQHILQAALSSVGPHDTNVPAVPNAVTLTTPAVTPASTSTIGARRRGNTEKRSKKPSPRDKEYVIRRNDIIHDLLKVSEADLFHQANTVDNDVKLIIQGQEKNTKLGLLSPLHRFATFANLAAHYDSDFAPKNAGVYYNYEYFQLYLAYRDLEMERSMQHQDTDGISSSSSSAGASPVSRPVMMQCRADIEKVLVNTNWEAIRRRLTIGERICQVCGILGRGYLLLSKQVSGRKLLHNFNAGEWGEFLREFQRPETLTLLQNLQTKLSPERLYQQQQQQQQQQHPAYTQLPTSATTLPSESSETTLKPSTTTRQAPLVIPYTSNSPTSSPPPSPSPALSSNNEPMDNEDTSSKTDDERQYKKLKVDHD
ncbi:hypothetical protein BC941DRAFT_464726 [Chlamydoabsidia padenii]|nr:hypothetical protein BC941DRAFT_464726 [Chlamydoabsidia padenii]